MVVETTLEQMRSAGEYDDWHEAMVCAMGGCGGGEAMPDNPLFTLDDVAEVIASVEGENDDAEWAAVFKLKDGRYGGITAWCDYTGWG